MSPPRASVAGVEAEFSAEPFEWDARQADTWVFVHLPTDLADDLLDAGAHAERGFGSLRVEVRVGTTTWRTSIFPSRTAQTYVLPLKKAVRRAEGIQVGEPVRVHLRLLDV